MEPTQTINLIALSLIVVMHAGVLALRLGISLGRNWNLLENLYFQGNNKVSLDGLIQKK